MSDANDNEVIITWINNKLKDTCRTLCKFVLYVNYPRPGNFLEHESPIIHLPLVKYIIEEIYDCSSLLLANSTAHVPKNFIDNTRRYVAGYLPTARLPMDTVEYIWKYISYQVSVFLKDNTVADFRKQEQNKIASGITADIKKWQDYLARVRHLATSKKGTLQLLLDRQRRLFGDDNLDDVEIPANKDLLSKNDNTTALGLNDILVREEVQYAEQQLAEAYTIKNKLATSKDVQSYIATQTAKAIEIAELSVLSRPCPDTKIYQLAREIDGCILRSMVYVVVALMDWLEVDNVTATEITFALDIILPADMQKFISKNPPETELNVFKTAFLKEIAKYKLQMKNDDIPALEIMVDTMNTILTTLSPDSSMYKRFSNRVKFFANSI